MGTMVDFSILVVEDDADDRFLLQAAFKENGIEEHIIFAENGVEVMNYLSAVSSPKKFPDLILLDLNMPKKGGREVLIELRQCPLLSTIPTIIFSTTQNELEMKNCFELGATSYIIKPDNFEKLIKIVSDIHSKWISPLVNTHREQLL